MKKFLSLVLALVMTMSLVTVSAGAKDFADGDKINYPEAVDVMSTLGVVGGYTDGSFKPSDTLTRGAAAKIICNLIDTVTGPEAGYYPYSPDPEDNEAPDSASGPSGGGPSSVSRAVSVDSAANGSVTISPKAAPKGAPSPSARTRAIRWTR